MLTRIPKLVPDSPWEAKGIAIVKSITDSKVIIILALCPMNVV